MLLGSVPAHAEPSSRGQSAATAAVAQAQSKAAADGERIFRALYSGAGDTRLGIPRIAAADAKVEPYGAVWNALVGQVSKEDRGYFATFSAQMRSGDPYLVTEALDDGQRRIERAIKALSPDAATHNGSDDMSAACTVGVVACAVIAVVVSTGGAAVNYVAAVNVVAIVNAGTWVNGFWGYATPNEDSPGGEAFIRDLTMRLAK